MPIFSGRILPVLLFGGLLIVVPAWVNAEPDEGTQRGYRSAHQHRDGRHHFASHIFHSLLRHAKELGLSDEQVTKLKSLMTEYQKTRIRDKADVKLAEVEVRALTRDEKTDMSVIENAVRKSEAARTKFRLDRISAVRAASSVLTPEQREQFRSGRAMHADGIDPHGGSAPESTREVARADKR